MTSLSHLPSRRPRESAPTRPPDPAASDPADSDSDSADSDSADREFAERGVVAEGTTARDWLLRHGVTVSASGGYLRLFADAICSRELTLRRVWHTAREVERRGRAGGAVISLLVEGSLTLRDDAGAEREVATGGGFVLWSDSSVAAISRGRCGTVEVAVSREILERFFAWADAGATVIPQGLTTARILLAAATTALTGPLAPRDPAWDSICSMIASGISALLAEVGPALLPSAPVTAVRLLRRAHVAIERHCRDASFDVRSLAEELSVSMTTLYAAFEHSPCTPAQAIRSARVGLARRMLDHRVSPTAADREAVAELAGFLSAPAMSKALRADRRRRGG
ncbi:hypothetical protein C5D07_02825 [Rathayibacter tritici]|uniref:AraC family transcriptional regulator n=1 Tax=Rathayibacter tritici TaxID=33888 RepID=UPI000CE824A3|nr:AraC family transcriptional regulator [Rathayibacter tritici]PPF23046.1 hypothetical protein C5C06_14535 [Rathayibacter tritici]PPI18832.1 hypothetical protein C5D07_02825 [Rathayibacter tritici]